MSLQTHISHQEIIFNLKFLRTKRIAWLRRTMCVNVEFCRKDM
jgi:hypothetical protein